MKLHLFLSLLFIVSCGNTQIINKDADTKTTEEYSDKESHISKEECRKLREYCLSKGFNENVCVLVDFSEYSGNERLYIYNLNKNFIEESGRVAHGIGKNGSYFNESFSNEPESWLSSLGRYKIGKLRTLNIPNFNNIPCLEVHGLDYSNSNAHKRGIVIHPGLLTSKKTITPCEPFSQGCFTVGSETFQTIKSLTQKSTKPILLYAYHKFKSYEKINNICFIDDFFYRFLKCRSFEFTKD